MNLRSQRESQTFLTAATYTICKLLVELFKARTNTIFHQLKARHVPNARITSCHRAWGGCQEGAAEAEQFPGGLPWEIKKRSLRLPRLLPWVVFGHLPTCLTCPSIKTCLLHLLFFYYLSPSDAERNDRTDLPLKHILAGELSWLIQSPMGQDTLWWETSSQGLPLGISTQWTMNTAEEPLQARDKSQACQASLDRFFFFFVLESHWLTGEWGNLGWLLRTLVSKTQPRVWEHPFSYLSSCFVLSYTNLQVFYQWFLPCEQVWPWLPSYGCYRSHMQRVCDNIWDQLCKVGDVWSQLPSRGWVLMYHF